MKKVAKIAKQCVACGNCVKACPFGTIQISYGITSIVDEEKCVGCGKCTLFCPADVITITERGA